MSCAFTSPRTRADLKASQTFSILALKSTKRCNFFLFRIDDSGISSADKLVELGEIYNRRFWELLIGNWRIVMRASVKKILIGTIILHRLS